MEINQQQIASFLRMLLSAGGPLSALIIAKTGVTESDYNMYLSVALAVVPPIGAAIWGWADNRKTKQVSNVASMPAADQLTALAKVPPEVKVKIAEATPGVETVVLSDNVNGKLAEMAQSAEHPNIVTATQNEADAKSGTGGSKT